MRFFTTEQQLREACGIDLGTSSWLLVTQTQVDAFAAVTRDHAPIHVNTAYAALSPFGTTIAHGLYVLSLGPGFGGEIADFTGLGQNLNYGYEKVRFPSPLPIGSRVRMGLQLRDVEALDTGLRLRLRQRFEAQGSEKPVCVAEGIIHVLE